MVPSSRSCRFLAKITDNYGIKNVMVESKLIKIDKTDENRKIARGGCICNGCDVAVEPPQAIFLFLSCCFYQFYQF
jgi:hypothetical protein